MPIVTRDNGGKSIANSEDYNLAGDMAEIVDSLNVGTVCANEDAMLALTTFPGRMCLRLDDMTIYVYNGTWKRVTPKSAGAPYAMAAGTVSFDMGNQASNQLAVNFPAGRFTQPPIISLGKAMSGGNKMIPYAATITSGGFNLGFQTADGTNSSLTVGCMWTAVQMSPTNGAG